jgi:hypothetical protein
MGKECRSPRKVQVLATTAVDDGVTIEEYAGYFDGDDEINSEYEFEYAADIASDSREDVWHAFVVQTVNYDSDGMPALIFDSDDSGDEYEQEMKLQRKTTSLLANYAKTDSDHDTPAMYMVALSTQEQMHGSLSLDTQSSVNITPDASLLSDIKHCKPILVGGINKNGEPLKIDGWHRDVLQSCCFVLNFVSVQASSNWCKVGFPSCEEPVHFAPSGFVSNIYVCFCFYPWIPWRVLRQHGGSMKGPLIFP